MRALGFISMYLLAAVTVGSTLGWLLAPLVDVPYDKLLSRGILLAMALGLVPLWRQFSLSLDRLGFEPVSYGDLARGFGLGLLIVLPLMLFFYVVGFRVTDQDLDLTKASFWGEVLWILFSAWLVALFEETLFRGAFYTGVERAYGYVAAAVITSLCYSVVHFLEAPEGIPGGSITWTTGFVQVGVALEPLLDPGSYWDSFVALFLLGLLFCWVRRHIGLWRCVALHASWVFAIRVFKEGTVRDIVNPYIGWVGTYDHFVGHLVSVWLVFIFLLLALNRARQGRTLAG